MPPLNPVQWLITPTKIFICYQICISPLNAGLVNSKTLINQQFCYELSLVMSRYYRSSAPSVAYVWWPQWATLVETSKELVISHASGHPSSQCNATSVVQWRKPQTQNSFLLMIDRYLPSKFHTQITFSAANIPSKLYLPCNEYLLI